MPEDAGKLPDWDTTKVNMLVLLSNGLSSLFSLRNGFICSKIGMGDKEGSKAISYETSLVIKPDA